MQTAPGAIYQHLVKDLSYTLNRDVIFDAETVPLDVKKRAGMLLAEDFLKKVPPTDAEPVHAKTFEVFQQCNDDCANWNLKIGSSSDDQLWGSFRQIVDDFFNVYLGSDVECTWPNIALEARSGPGSSVGCQGTSHYGKFYSGPLTATDPFLLDLYRAHISLWPEESNAEIIRAENFGSPVYVKGSMLSFVPKTVKSSRLICVEPTVNMYYQLGLGEVISKRLKRFFGIDLSTQPSTNRYMAWAGSRVDSTFGDGFATIDLSSASDRLSLKLISEIVPSEWLSAILSLRSDYTVKRGAKGNESIKLNMVSTMGNGFTFPLQTAIFACAAAAAVYESDGIRQTPRAFALGGRMGQFSVFGDDIVIESRFAARLLHLLDMLGSKPNLEKTFTSGAFRESCGHDYMSGYNIRPVYVRKNILGDQDLVILANLLAEWSVRLEIPLVNTLRFIISRIRSPNAVPLGVTEDEGIRLPRSLSLRLGRQFGIRGFANHGSVVYSRRSTVANRIRISDGAVKVPKGAKRHIYNPSGLWMSFLLGEVRGGSISIRGSKAIYRTKQAVSPCWDYRRPLPEDEATGLALSNAELVARLGRLWAAVFDGDPTCYSREWEKQDRELRPRRGRRQGSRRVKK